MRSRPGPWPGRKPGHGSIGRLREPCRSARFIKDLPAALRLSPGPLAGRKGTVACTWMPCSAVSAELMWAVLDCPGGWTLDQVPAPWVLSRMTARIAAYPVPGETTVAVARGELQGERRARCLSALYRTNG